MSETSVGEVLNAGGLEILRRHIKERLANGEPILHEGIANLLATYDDARADYLKEIRSTDKLRSDLHDALGLEEKRVATNAEIVEIVKAAIQARDELNEKLEAVTAERDAYLAEVRKIRDRGASDDAAIIDRLTKQRGLLRDELAAVWSAFGQPPEEVTEALSLQSDALPEPGFVSKTVTETVARIAADATAYASLRRQLLLKLGVTVLSMEDEELVKKVRGYSDDEELDHDPAVAAELREFATRMRGLCHQSSDKMLTTQEIGDHIANLLADKPAPAVDPDALIEDLKGEQLKRWVMRVQLHKGCAHALLLPEGSLAVEPGKVDCAACKAIKGLHDQVHAEKSRGESPREKTPDEKSLGHALSELLRHARHYFEVLDTARRARWRAGTMGVDVHLQDLHESEAALRAAISTEPTNPVDVIENIAEGVAAEHGTTVDRESFDAARSYVNELVVPVDERLRLHKRTIEQYRKVIHTLGEAVTELVSVVA